MYDLAVIGGGAAGFFTAIQLAQRRPGSRIIILEKGKQVLSKVKVSGGGRCNVTHACFIPSEMVEHYPRGSKELLGPFHRFLCGDMMAWLSEQGVETKIEGDGRVFPESNSSQTIIDCFLRICRAHDIQIQTSSGVTGLRPDGDTWTVEISSEKISTRQVMLATGSTPSVWKMLGTMGYTIVDPVPSLFTFNIEHKLLEDIPGLSMPQVQVKILGTRYEASGPLLITHWGLSGPAVLKLSAWAARELHGMDYRFEIAVDWLGAGAEYIRSAIAEERQTHGNRMVKKYPLCGIPRRLWERFCYMARLRESNFASLTAQQMEALIGLISDGRFPVDGKSTFKEEFVTCGGVERKQVDFKTMESKLHPGLYLAGEVLDIDAITGGFNFQAAWTEGVIAAEAMG